MLKMKGITPGGPKDMQRRFKCLSRKPKKQKGMRFIKKKVDIQAKAREILSKPG